MNRFVNTLLLVLFCLLGATAVVMLYGAWLPWVFDLHRMAGFSLLAVAPWKGVIIYRSLRRGIGPSFDRRTVIYASLILLAFVILVIVLGLAWIWRLGPYSYLLQSLISWHWILGLVLAPWFLFHLWRRWPNPRRSDLLSRREFFKLAGVAAAGVIGGWLANSLGNALAAAPTSQGLPEARRFTGSRQMGIAAGNDFPLTGEAAPSIDIHRWQLEITGAVPSPFKLSYPELLQRAHSQTIETLDCTSGWYSTQSWGGLRLVDLLAEAGVNRPPAGVRLVSISGYNHTFPLIEARNILLATHVGEEVLAPEHGFPLRAVVPGRRGWFWVKWLSRVEVLDNPAQVMGGILAAPGQVLSQW